MAVQTCGKVKSPTRKTDVWGTRLYLAAKLLLHEAARLGYAFTG
jgi:hypothetical protein